MFAWERTRPPKPMDSVRITAFLLMHVNHALSPQMQSIHQSKCLLPHPGRTGLGDRCELALQDRLSIQTMSAGLSFSGISILLSVAFGSKLELICQVGRAKSLNVVGLLQILLVQRGFPGILEVDSVRIIDCFILNIDDDHRSPRNGQYERLEPQ